MTTLLENVISRYAGNLVGGLSATSTSQITINPMPALHKEDGTTVVLTDVGVILSPNQQEDYGENVGAEEFSLTGGTLNSDGSGTYNQVTRGIANNSTGDTPVGHVNWQTSHQDGAPVIIDPTYKLRGMDATFTAAIAEIEDESNNIVTALGGKIKASEQRMVDIEDAFQIDINTQQSNFETDITTQQDNYEEEVDLKLDSFDARQSLLSAVKNATTATQLDVSGGNWLDGTTERLYAGASVSPTLSATTYYELETGTGTLISNSSGFGLSGNYPICKVICDATEITEVSNYGIYRTIDEPEYFNGVMTSVVYTDGFLTSFIDGDSVTHTFTYDDDGNLHTASDGTDTSTINRDTDGNFTGVSFS